MARRVCMYSLLTAAAMLFSFIEGLYSLNVIAPGIKLGLANCAAMLLLARGDVKGAFLVNITRILLGTLLFSFPASLIFSLSAGIVSLLGATLLKKTGLFSVMGLCIAAGVLHNITQLAAAALVMQTAGLVYYLPLMLVCGVICGILTGTISQLMTKYIKV